MTHIRLRALAGPTASLTLTLILAGCGGGERYASTDFTPPKETARGALEAALASWRDGKPYGQVEGAPAEAQVVDSTWQKGEKLGSFEILGEDEADGTKQFSVRLSMTTPPGSREVRYYILGREPVRIFRDDDYKRLIDMDNNPAASKAPRRR